VHVVVLIPAFAAQNELVRTLASLAADPAPFDVLVVDDGSEPPLEVPATVGSHVVTTLRLPANEGIARALNAGIQWVLDRPGRVYDAVARLDAGDLHVPGRFERQVAFLTHHEDVALVGGATRHLDEAMRVLFVSHYPESWAAIRRRLHYRNPFSHGACMMRLAAIRQVGGYDERYPMGEDYDLFWRVSATYSCANLPDVLVERVESTTSLTHAHRIRMARTRLHLQMRYFSWRRLDCWLGLGRSVMLLPCPVSLRWAVKRALGEVF
jgi:GT2 family glycosyltransferase